MVIFFYLYLTSVPNWNSPKEVNTAIVSITSEPQSLLAFSASLLTGPLAILQRLLPNVLTHYLYQMLLPTVST